MTDRPELLLAHSPDSDDLVMWWPLVGMDERDSPRVETGRFRYKLIGQDVEQLNRRASGLGDLDITAISAATYPYIADRYAITDCGGSFGEGYGPKLVVREGDGRFVPGDLSLLTRKGIRVGVPGLRTTAFMTLSLMVGETTPVEMPFMEIIDAVQREEIDAGLLIHEAQLTYERAGLRAVADVGAWWTERMDLPLPLGLNVIKRDLDRRFGAGSTDEVVRALSASVAYSVEHAEESRQYLLSRGEDRPEWNDPALLERYLSMYVSKLTLSMGSRGRTALTRLFDEASEVGLCPPVGEVEVLG